MSISASSSEGKAGGSVMIESGSGLTQAGDLSLHAGLSHDDGAVISLEGSQSMQKRGRNITATAGTGLLDGGTIAISGSNSNSSRDGGSVKIISGSSDLRVKGEYTIELHTH
jgi:hypothetical protein